MEKNKMTPLVRQPKLKDYFKKKEKYKMGSYLCYNRPLDESSKEELICIIEDLSDFIENEINNMQEKKDKFRDRLDSLGIKIVRYEMSGIHNKCRIRGKYHKYGGHHLSSLTEEETKILKEES
uniref:Uncharacterized protein n=2 Tax=viral metagenome TaxID=1070528 RepID=A0A6M3L0E7_9ZZZZ